MKPTWLRPFPLDPIHRGDLLRDAEVVQTNQLIVALKDAIKDYVMLSGIALKGSFKFLS
jgi:hypothetical protein